MYMKPKHILILILVTDIFASCKGPKEKIDISDGKISVREAQKIAEQAKESISESERRLAARRAKGDTVAMPYKELQAYLPDISGYKKEGGPRGSQMNMPGLAGRWSQTEQSYSNGDMRIEVTLFDYNGAIMAFTAATAIYKAGFASEDDTKRTGSVDLGLRDVTGYETVFKQDPRAELTLVVVDRFLIQMQSEGSSDVEALKNVARGMRLADLAAR
jgi:hypothetical protein